MVGWLLNQQKEIEQNRKETLTKPNSGGTNYLPPDQKQKVGQSAGSSNYAALT